MVGVRRAKHRGVKPLLHPICGKLIHYPREPRLDTRPFPVLLAPANMNLPGTASPDSIHGLISVAVVSVVSLHCTPRGY
jgi:hypothetical protein